MDPYLEHPGEWPGFHNRFIADLQTLLGSLIVPAYFINLEERVYISTMEDDDRVARRSRVPDILVSRSRNRAPLPRRSTAASSEPIVILEEINGTSVREWFLTIREARNREVVTIVEVLSPSNKSPQTTGRRKYHRKRTAILNSKTNLVEIDLLRAGRGWVDRVAYDYHAYVSESASRPEGLLWPIRLADKLPQITIPLAAADRVALDLQTVFTMAYDNAFYSSQLDYTQDPVPPLTPAQARWAKKLLKSRS